MLSSNCVESQTAAYAFQWIVASVQCMDRLLVNGCDLLLLRFINTAVTSLSADLVRWRNRAFLEVA